MSGDRWFSVGILKATRVIRGIFKEGQKYKNGKTAAQAMDILIEEWKRLKLGGAAKWPFSQGRFDDFVQKINNDSQLSNLTKDEKVKEAAVRYRRIKEINTLRNDFIETLIFEKNKNILPTLKHVRGVDFFINGEQYDQKVASSPTKQFQKDFGLNWQKKAISSPKLVAKYLYEHQDEGRFDWRPRLLIVSLEAKIDPGQLQKCLKQARLKKPLEISFKFNHKIEGVKLYKTKCFVVLLPGG